MVQQEVPLFTLMDSTDKLIYLKTVRLEKVLQNTRKKHLRYEWTRY